MSDRKYRQRGYMEDAGREERRREPPRRDPREGPKGRGLGAPTQEVFKCSACGHRQPAVGEVAFGAVCPKCGADLHTCSNCAHFDTSAPNECRAGVPVRIPSKTKRNDCQLFTPRVVMERAPEGRDPTDPRAAFDALFKL